MAVPSRVYVGVVVFGLIATLAIAAYVLLLVTGYEPPPDSPFEALFPQDEPLPAGEVLFLSLAGFFALGFTVVAWRALVRGARRDAATRRRRAALARDMRVYRGQSGGKRPPGPT